MALSASTSPIHPHRLDTMAPGSAQAMGPWRCSLALSVHEQFLGKEPARKQTQSMLSSQSLQVSEKQSKMKASHRQPAGREWWYLLHISEGGNMPKKSDQHKVQILSKAVAAPLGTLEPGDRAKICIKQFTELTGPGFNGIEKVLTNQGPWQGLSLTTPSQAIPPWLQSHQLC